MYPLYFFNLITFIINMNAPLQMKPTRIRAFIDFWNIQLTMNEREASENNIADCRVKIDWQNIGSCLAQIAAKKANVENNYSFDGVVVYASFNPKNVEGRHFNKWMTTWLNRQPGIQVQCLERQPKAPPKCPSCYKVIEYCPHPDCGSKIMGTIEKGVDTLISTDMIRLAWEDAYDIAVLASSDRDLVPAVQFLISKGRKIIQAGFPPSGVHLATSCWASFDIFALRSQIIRL
jgi:uncharacterized LabA/DUF88 family protein